MQKSASAPLLRATPPENTLIVSPDNASRTELNIAVRQELKATGAVATEDHNFRVLVQRQDMTGAERSWATTTRSTTWFATQWKQNHRNRSHRLCIRRRDRPSRKLPDSRESEQRTRHLRSPPSQRR
jgi:hypothetical protein